MTSTRLSHPMALQTHVLRLHISTSSLGLLLSFRRFSSQLLQRSGVDKCWQVSNHGRCKNTFGSISFGTLQVSGYRNVKISGSYFYVHRLVAFAFLGPPPNELAWQVHHRDGNPSNNSLENLEYATASLNALHSFANTTRCKGGHLSSRPVMWRATGSQSWTTSPSIKQAAAKLSMNRDTISRACSQCKSTKGYEFQWGDFGHIEQVDGEEWRQMHDPVSGCKVPGRMVSSLGRITSQRNRTYSGCLRKSGYYKTHITLSSNARTELVHRLVAFAFLGPPVPPRKYVNHIDLDKGNNAANNLEYVTPAENVAHSYYANCMRTPRLDGKAVESRLRGCSDGWSWHLSITAAGRALGLNPGNISSCLSGRQRHTGGFEFRLTNQHQVQQGLPNEEWRSVDIEALLREKAARIARTCP